MDTSLDHRGGTVAQETRQHARVGGPVFHLGYRPALDGVRGLAILMVLGAHTYALSDTFGFIGVELFFALSGFLITCLLVEEWRKTGKIGRKAFYARRALRLLPALLLMLTVFMAYAAVSGPRKFFRHNLHETLFALFYSTNWMQVYDQYYFRFLRHTWSLSVEEQFYFIWPALLVWMLRRFSRESMINWILMGAFLFWVTRFVVFQSTTANATQLANALHPESLLLGCAAGLSLSFGLLRLTAQIEPILRYGAVAAWIGLGWMGCESSIFGSFMVSAGWFLTSLFSAIIVCAFVLVPRTWLRKAFENPALVFVGKISYGLYLWNSIVLETIKREFSWPTWVQGLVGTVVILLVALLSYFLLELPCLRLKKRFEKTPQE